MRTVIGLFALNPPDLVFCPAFAANAAAVGSFAVVGDTGAAAVHALPFANDLLFLVWRASNLNGTSFNPLLAVGLLQQRL